MYDMYPENWASDTTARSAGASAQPRRRVRREHRILPVVLPVTAGPLDDRAPGSRVDRTR